MRDASIPAWTFLREPSASSGALSDDELLGSSQETAADELVHTPPLQSAPSSRRMPPPPVPGPSSVRSRGGGRLSGNYGTYSSSSAPRRPPSPSRTRRAHSGSDEEEERPKKKKRGLQNDSLSQTVLLSPRQRENATHQRHSGRAPPSNTAEPHRRATIAGPFLPQKGRSAAEPLSHPFADKQPRNERSSSKPPTPLSQAQARSRAAKASAQSASARAPVTGPSTGNRQPSTSGSASQPASGQQRKSVITPDNVVDLTQEPSEAPTATRSNRRASALAIPPAREVIEIIDSDEEPPPPLPPPKLEKSEPTLRRELPRRRSKPESSKSGSSKPGYRVDTDGALILDSSDDDDPPPGILAAKVNPTSVQPKEPSPEQQQVSSPAPASPLLECKMSPPLSPVLWNRAHPPDDRMLASPPTSCAAPPPLADVDMSEDTAVAFDAGEMSRPVDFEMELGKGQVTSGETRSSPETMQEMVQDVPPAVNPPMKTSATAGEDPEARNTEPELLAGTEASLHVDNSDAAARVVEMDPISQTPRQPEAAQMDGPTLSLSTACSPASVANLRAATASPVSGVLDPGLQGLAITECSSDSTDLARSVSGISSSSSTAVSTPGSPGSATRKRSVKLADRSPWKMHGAAHGGPTGWFHHNRLSQKRRTRLSNSPAPRSPLATSLTSSPTASVAASLAGPLQESPKAASPTADASKAPLDDAVAQEKTTSSSPLQPPEEPDMGMPADPILQGISSTETAAVQSGIPQQPLVQSPKVHAVPEEGKIPSVPMVTEVPKSHAADRRSETPPADDPQSTPLGPTLSQIIRNAANENARRNIIDLTFDKSDDDRGAISPRKPADKPVYTNDPLSASSGEKVVASLQPSTPSTARMIDFNSIRKDRKVHLRTPQLQHSSPTKLTIPPLPRNVRRGSAPEVLNSTPLAQASKPSVAASISVAQDAGPPGALVGENSPSVTLASVPSPKLVLPRRPQVLRNVRATQSATSGGLDTSRKPTAPLAPATVPEDGMVVDDSGTPISAGVPPPDPIVPSGDAESPPRSASPPTDATEEEECRSLIYPSTTPEESPEAEVPDEDEFPIRSHTSRRTRSQASSEASSGPRRSARLSSSSASSSVEPEDLPRPRLRRREPVAIRTHSDDDIASQGGISRFRNRYSRAFEAAGFESLSWKKDRRRMAKEFAPVTQSAENIPHDLHDRLNALPPSARHASNLQAIFEAEIAANTAEDEPNAPPIRVINDVDDEPTPPMEFYYSNLMWHSTDVPRPDFDALKGCGCVGACNPNSKTCACVRRQRTACDGMAGFLYEQKGKLKTHEYPIFECNINCGCSDDCPNRVIQHGRRYEIAIRKTVNKGWGIFAGPKKIPGMSFVGVYAGEYLTDEEGEKRGLHYNSFGRTYLFDLDFYHINKGVDNPLKYTVDAYHAGNFTRYLNHSCDPNCAIVPGYINECNIDKPLLTIFTLRDVDPYEEMCFDYSGADDGPVGMDKDAAVFVECQCGTPNCKGYVWK